MEENRACRRDPKQFTKTGLDNCVFVMPTVGHWTGWATLAALFSPPPSLALRFSVMGFSSARWENPIIASGINPSALTRDTPIYRRRLCLNTLWLYRTKPLPFPVVDAPRCNLDGTLRWPYARDNAIVWHLVALQGRNFDLAFLSNKLLDRGQFRISLCF